MSVKGKVKRLNKEVERLNLENQKLKKENCSLSYLKVDRTEEEIKRLKDCFIKLLVTERLPMEHNQCVLRVTRERLEMMNKADLKVEYNPYINEVEFRVRI